ncbi:hypothetical protein HAX54_032671 [Datura stramonium]|uniref:Uncharacterized protein n=1 Tax=Datura stramonium TaxID=4076 RepID=A0ABS8VE36_DATST|nr:hypothetical protein [Datura stramonium]
MAPKPSKGKGVASSSHGSKRSRRDNEEEHDDLINVGEIIKYVLRRARAKGAKDLGLGVSWTDFCIGTRFKRRRVGSGFEEPLDNDMPTNEEMARVDSDIESNEEEEVSEMGEAALPPTDDEE